MTIFARRDAPGAPGYSATMRWRCASVVVAPSLRDYSLNVRVDLATPAPNRRVIGLPAVGYFFGLGVKSTPDRLRFVVAGAAGRAAGSALPERTRTRNDGFVETANDHIGKSETDIIAE